MAETPQPLSQFPSAAVAASRAVRRADAAMALASFDRVRRAGRSRDLLRLRDARFTWRFHLARRADGIVFFFVRTTGPVEVVLDATAVLTFTPLAAPFPPLPTGAPAHRWMLPPLIVARPDPADLAPFPGAPPGSVLVLAVGRRGAHRLAVRFGADDEARRLAWTTPSGTTAFAADDIWPVAPFLDLVAALREWTRADPQDGTPLALTTAAASDVVRIVTALARGWVAAGAGARPTDDAVSADVAWLVPAFGIEALEARVQLLLGPDGRLASSGTDDPLHLALLVHVTAQDDQPLATAAIVAPDVLAAGPLLDAFVARARSSEFVEALLPRVAPGIPDAATLTALLGDPAATWAVFRVAREAARDTDVFVWEGRRAGTAWVIVFQADVVVRDGTTEPVVELADPPHVRSLYAGPPDGTLGPPFRQTRRHVLRLLTEMRRWRAAAA